MNIGLFELKTPQDLLNKLRREYERLQLSPLDQDVAFNFFVTAEHMSDWIYPGASGSSNAKHRNELKEKNTLLLICSHLANGSKHFEVNNKRHNSVSDTSISKGAFQRNAFQADAFQVSQLIIHLEQKAEKEFGKTIKTLKFAEMVLAFWENYMETLPS